MHPKEMTIRRTLRKPEKVRKSHCVFPKGLALVQVYIVSQWLADSVGEAISAFDLDEGESNAHRSCELHVFFNARV